MQRVLFLNNAFSPHPVLEQAFFKAGWQSLDSSDLEATQLADLLVAQNLPSSMEAELRGRCKALLAVEIGLPRAHQADYLVNFDPNIQASSYEPLVDTNCRLFLVSEYKSATVLANAVTCSFLTPTTARDKGDVSLRAATIKDAELMFAWQTDERTRRYARNPRKPSWNEHITWLEAYLTNPQGNLFVVEHAGSASGILRLDELQSPFDFEVSVVADPKKYRHGVGVPALQLARAWAPRSRLYAEVLPGNTASQQMVMEAGFTQSAPGKFLCSPLLPAT